ncbi:MAG: hypothetical protein R2851_17750 [Caldilineaceae bacterium]
MRYDGTKARCVSASVVNGDHHLPPRRRRENVPIPGLSGHGGGDEGIMTDFVKVLRAKPRH